jgi:amino acid adenylation domain-containing protein
VTDAKSHEGMRSVGEAGRTGARRRAGDAAATIQRLVAARAALSPAAPALLGSSRRALTYADLSAQIGEIGGALAAAGVGRVDRVALIAPDGPELAAAFLGVAAAAACAPLNPRYTEPEIDFALGDLDVKLLLVAQGLDTPARGVAARRGIPVADLVALDGEAAGRLRLSVAVAPSAPVAPPRADDVALVLHTSGTTARPKTVPLSHANLTASAAAIAATLRLSPADRSLCVMPLFHIHGLVGVLLASLSVGASVWCAEGFVAPDFLGWLVESGATWYSAVPTMHQAVLARILADPRRAAGHRLRFVRSSSAPLPPPVMAALEDALGIPMIEAYGMTEASHQMTSNPLPQGPRKVGSVGVPAGPEVAIMGAGGALLPVGQRGEVVIRGPGVTRGYEANPEANARAFVGGWFRTGDEGWLDADGYLFLSGRLKEMINRGGEKIAPREVDEALLAHPAVSQAVAFGAPHASLGEEVAAAVVLRPGAAASEATLQAFVAGRLAEFKVPRRIVGLDEIPKGPTGKVQRIGLAKRLGVDFRAPARGGEHEAPRSDGERALATIWAEVLGVARVGVGDDFFALGGDSILAMRVRARVLERLGVELPLPAFFADSQLGAMASVIDAARASGDRAPAVGAIRRLPRSGRLPLSFTQERMWFLEQLEPGAALFNRPVAIRLRGRLSGAAIEDALVAVAARHEILRARIESRDDGPALALAARLDLDLPETDLRDVPDDERPAALLEALRGSSRRSFDLAAGPLLRSEVFRLADDEVVLLVVFHHVVFDGTSVGVLMSELAARLEASLDGVAPELPALATQFVDWAAWHRVEVQERETDGGLDYWTARLAGAPQVLDLPADRVRPAAPTFVGVEHVASVTRAVASRLGALGREHRTSLFTVLLAAFATLLHRLTGREDVLLGCPVSGRTRLETESLIGSFINTLVLRVELEVGTTFAELVERCRATVEGALAHQEMPFERVVEALHPPRDLSRNPLYQVMLQLRNLHEPAVGSGRIAVEEMHFDRGVAGVDVALDVRRDGDGGLECVFNFAAELFEPSTRARFTERFVTLLRSACERPDSPIGRLSLFGEGERDVLLEAWQGPRAAVTETRAVSALVSAMAAARPEATAVEDGDERCDYGVLEARTDRLARLLVDRGVKRDEPVGIALPRSLAMIESVLAVLKAGGCYVPLDPELPATRIEFMRRDAAIRHVLTTSRLAHEAGPLAEGAILLDRERERFDVHAALAPDVEVAPGQLAYIIYTSGSTGIPKGAMNEHGGLAAMVRACGEAYGVCGDDRVLQFASLAFDTSAAEIFVALTNGATLVLRPPGPAAASGPFLRWCGERALTVAFVPSAYWHQLAADMVAFGLALPPSLRLVQVGGEAVQAEALARWHRCSVGGVRLVNSYGPAETSVMCTFADLGPEEVGRPVVPIGRPFANSRAYVLDKRGEMVPIGVAGELCIGGSGVGRGYLGRAELTSERFVPDPFATRPGSRMYRTGDRARWRHDGRLEFLGRLDFQVKIRGQRVEPGEIEAALLGDPVVGQAAVVSRPGRDGEPTLVAYLVPAPGRALVVKDVRNRLVGRLPAWMLPDHLVVLSGLPVGVTGKVDRSALPEPDLAAASPAPARPPRTPLETAIAAIWSAVLGRSNFGVDDDFFEIGGHSLHAIRVANALCDDLGIDVPVSVLFAARTIEVLAARVETLRRTREARTRGEEALVLRVDSA